MSDFLQPHESQHARPPGPSPTPGVYLNSCRVGDAIQPSHPLSSPSSLAFHLSQHQGVLQWVSSSHQVAKVLEKESGGSQRLRKKHTHTHIWLILIICGSILVNLSTCWNVLLLSKSINAHMLSWSLTDMQSGGNWYPDVHAPSGGWTKWHSLCFPVPALTP